MERSKPAQNHTDDVAFPETVSMRPIGVIHSPYKERFGTPRQAPVTEQTLTDEAVDATIELFPRDNLDQALRGLDGFDYVWVLAWLHLNQHWNPMVTPPRGPKVKQGVLATRAPHRPNPIGLSALRLTSVDGRVLHVRGIDLLDGTPVLDIKPYVPYADAFPDARAGWLDTLDQAQDAPDRYEPTPPKS